MKILHTADWHLGKRLDKFSRFEEQKQVMEEIISTADTQQADMVLIAGDLFDSFNPSTEAVELFYHTIKRLAKNGERPVIAIAGNHDSPNMIDAPIPLARECGIFLIGYPKAEIQKFKNDFFEITNSDAGFVEIKLRQYPYPVRLIHTAYANEIRLKEALGDDVQESLNSVLKSHWATLADQYCDTQGINLLMTHLFMNNANEAILEEPEGERPLKIGNADLIFTHTIPPQIQYTALGHLHAHHNIGSDAKPIVYSSSPLSYSFSEAGQQKYVMLIDIEPGQPASYHKIQLENGTPLIRKKFNTVDQAVEWLENNQNYLIELTIETDSFLTATDQKRIFQAHPGIIYLIPQMKNMEDETTSDQKQINLNQDFLSLFKDYFKSKNNGLDPNEEIISILKEIL